MPKVLIRKSADTDKRTHDSHGGGGRREGGLLALVIVSIH